MKDAIRKWRDLMGATNPLNASEGSIRRRFGTTIGRNATHGSDSNILPRRLIDLINQSIRLQERVLHADMILKNNSEDAPTPSGRNAVALQHLLIKSAFSRGATHH